jgi:hypothetical protein
VTCGTGIAALKVTSLMRPALLLKFSTLCDQLHVSGDRVNQELFKWSNLMSLSEEEFAKLFNNVDGLDVIEIIEIIEITIFAHANTPILFLIMINHSAKKVNLFDR